MSQFASETKVPVEKTRSEIEKTLSRYGADGFRYGWATSDDGRRVEQIDFTAYGRHVRFTVWMPSKDDPNIVFTPVNRERRSRQRIEREWNQQCRQRWRALLLSIKAKLEAVETGITSFESEFLAHIVVPGDGRTVEKVMAPQLEQRYEHENYSGLLGLPAPDDHP